MGEKLLKKYGFIFARGGSKGIPHKNIQNLCGKPLIAYSIEAGLKCGYLDKIIVSTDDPEIAKIAKNCGADVPFMRPASLAADNSNEWLSWQHAIKYYIDRNEYFDIFVSLPPTAPLRTSKDIISSINLYESGNCDIVITATKAHRSPYFNMVVENKDGTVSLILNPPNDLYRRQDAPEVYDMTTVAYVSSPNFILRANSIWDGRVKANIVDRIDAIDIDDYLDLEIATMFMSKRQTNKNEDI